MMELGVDATAPHIDTLRNGEVEQRFGELIGSLATEQAVRVGGDFAAWEEEMGKSDITIDEIASTPLDDLPEQVVAGIMTPEPDPGEAPQEDTTNNEGAFLRREDWKIKHRAFVLDHFATEAASNGRLSDGDRKQWMEIKKNAYVAKQDGDGYSKNDKSSQLAEDVQNFVDRIRS